jgi:N-succinyldiaminopimelate aminotransferase
VASLGQVNLGHFLPDYTAYEEMLDIFRLVTPIPILLRREQGYSFGVEDLRREVLGRGLSVLLFSNPCNPMGKLVPGGELADWIAVGRELDCTLLIDEFYSHYVCASTSTCASPSVPASKRSAPASTAWKR